MVLVNDSVTVAVMTEPNITPINIQQIPNALPSKLRGVTSPYLTVKRVSRINDDISLHQH